MAPASVAGATIRCSTSVKDAGRVTWDRDSIIEAIREWVATYDEPPRAADLNPSSAKWSGQTWRVERYRAGRADGTAWPSLNAAKRPFDGSLGAAVRAAGFEPGRPGPRRREVVPAQAARVQMTPDVRVVLDAALAAARDADRRADALAARLDRATARTTALAAERDAARRRSAGADARARASVEAELRRAEAALRRRDGEVVRVREDAAVTACAAADARAEVEAMALRLGAAERTSVALRADRDDLRERLDEAIAEGEALAELVPDRPAAGTVADDAADVTPVESGSRGGVAAPALREARAEVAAARRATAAAERRAAVAERSLRERVAADRPDSPSAAQVAALREGAATGEAGPAALGAAIAGLARARRSGGTPAVRDALWHVARAAVAWRERI
ncbi:hypothetical protein [Patulibacter americanus]|uniref:hypothetical protein n=1 Tax=Patulibacter americanus TaxID=588672 RepID=UPI0003B4FD8F|nr:hypothetical protein [Patulibacter americanus]